ncbi:ABC transporter ATP-binding protein [Gulosibacter sp. 10]|uniref:ABC transporter ATP-binding protein n=1 Tax=Gulosibacter sp. 10 TaxID=1255570 RepID=UPI000B35F027|nr:ABC transporter ATP-binding protein [Gulosibacter sp. 10]
MTADTSSAAGLVVGYAETEVLGPVDFSLRPGITALLGRNGAGKTTLMRTLCGIIPPLGGTCAVLGEPVSDGAAVRSRVGYLGHESALASSLTVRQNLEFWSTVTRTYPDAVSVSVDRLVREFDLTALLERKASALSRGQRQRVDLARLAMTEPRFVVLDEPLTGLDPVYAARTRALLSAWGERRTVLYSTHSVPEALALARRFLVLGARGLVELDSEREPVSEARILRLLEADS